MLGTILINGAQFVRQTISTDDLIERIYIQYTRMAIDDQWSEEELLKQGWIQAFYQYGKIQIIIANLVIIRSVTGTTIVPI